MGFKKQFSKEKEADDFVNYIQSYIDIRDRKRKRKENKLTITLKEPIYVKSKYNI